MEIIFFLSPSRKVHPRHPAYPTGTAQSPALALRSEILLLDGNFVIPNPVSQQRRAVVVPYTAEYGQLTLMRN